LLAAHKSDDRVGEAVARPNRTLHGRERFPRFRAVLGALAGLGRSVPPHFLNEHVEEVVQPANVAVREPYEYSQDGDDEYKGQCGKRLSRRPVLDFARFEGRRPDRRVVTQPFVLVLADSNRPECGALSDLQNDLLASAKDRHRTLVPLIVGTIGDLDGRARRRIGQCDGMPSLGSSMA